MEANPEDTRRVRQSPTVITQRERNELRSMIRARFKALRAGVEQRRADQQAEVERQINARYNEQKALYRAANEEGARLTAELNRRIRDLYAPLVGDFPEHGGYAGFIGGEGPDLERPLLRARATREVDAAAKRTLATLAAAEADALEAVARSAIESEEATALMASIPTLEMLMPMVELPSAAEKTVAEMTDPLMPWVDNEEFRAVYGTAGYRLRGHVQDWREAQKELPAVADEAGDGA